MNAPHYLRFARTLALATTIALPACSAADETPTEEEAQPAQASNHAAGTPGAAPSTATPAPIAKSSAPAVAPVSPVAEELLVVDAPPDAGSHQGHSSGPLPPLDMPASFA